MPPNRSLMGRIHDRVIPLPPFFRDYPVGEWPEDVYGGALAVRRAARLRFEVFLLLMGTMLATSLGAEDPLRTNLLQTLVVGVLWLGALTWSVWGFCAGAEGIARRRAKRNATKRPDLLPVTLLDDLELGARAHHHLQGLSLEQQEIARTLLSDGFDGSVADLVELTVALQES